MGMITETISVQSNAVVDTKLGSYSLELEKLVPENSCSFELIVPSASVVVEDHVFDEKNLIEKNSGVFEKTVGSTGVVDDQFEDYGFDYKKLIENDPWNYDTIEVDGEELQRRHPLDKVVPRKPKTPRYLVGQIICDCGKDLYYYANSSRITQRGESRKSKRHDGGKDSCYNPGSSMIRKKEESRKLKKHVCFDNYNGWDDDAETSNRSKMIARKEESRKLKKSWDDDAGPSKKKQKLNQVPRKIQHDNVQQGPPPELPHRFRDYIDNLNLAEPPLFVAQKPLTGSDVNYQQSRLSFPRAQIDDKFFDNFLTDVENKMLENKESIEVNVVDDHMHVYDTLHFRRWPMGKNSIYVLTKKWNRFASDHSLEENMVVQTWCFRVDSRICFCFAVNRDSKKEEESMINS